jgi:hypothetical protein
MTDDFEIIPPNNIKAKSVASLKSYAQEIIDIVRKSQPFIYLASEEEPSGPVELLLLFDSEARDHFKLVSVRSADYRIKLIAEK